MAVVAVVALMVLVVLVAVETVPLQEILGAPVLLTRVAVVP